MEIRDKPVHYKKDAEWLVKVKKELEVVTIQNNVVTIKENVIKQVRKMPNWKSPVLDYIQGFWLKRFSSLRQPIADFGTMNSKVHAFLNGWWKVALCLFKRTN